MANNEIVPIWINNRFSFTALEITACILFPNLFIPLVFTRKYWPRGRVHWSLYLNAAYVSWFIWAVFVIL